MEIFEAESYKRFVLTRISAMPNKGRGEFRKLAMQLRMHTTLISQVFNGDRHLSGEQACDLCQYWGLSALETEMFLTLVQYERAGSKALRDVLKKQLEQIRQRGEKLSYRLPQDGKLAEADQAVFYSNWYYSGARLLTSVPSCNSVDAIAERLNLSRALIGKVLSFLIKQGLVINRQGALELGPSRTHLSSDSPLVTRHHMNWRNKAMAKMERLEEHELMFTAPLTISKKDFKKIRNALLQLVDQVSGIVNDTEPEKLACLNIDWFEIS